VNLAAQAGVRYSLVNPYIYVEANVQGFLNILEGLRRTSVGQLVFASTSSVYGLNSTLPFDESQTTDHPVSLYAATKKANELMAHSYAHLFGIPMTGLRFFTVYGPWSRPDMALFKFTKAILAGETIQVFNHGKMVRDFTYIDDIVEGVMRVIDRPAMPDADWSSAHPSPATSSAPYRIFNIGNNEPIELMRYIHAIEAATGKKAKMQMLPIQPGDVYATSADVTRLETLTGFKPQTNVEDGVAKFVGWYRRYYAEQ
jgi:UDP-glucuronate 4-epimerase